MTIRSDCPPFTYTKVYLPTCSNFKGLNAELLTSEDGVSFYLNALTFEFQDTVEPGYATVYIEIDGETYSGEATRLAGGQKLILSQQLQEQIVEALFNSKTVNITIGRYQESLIPDNFAASYSSIKFSP